MVSCENTSIYWSPDYHSHRCHHKVVGVWFAYGVSLSPVRAVLSQPPDSEQHAYLNGTPCRRWLRIAGLDAGNNDNVDVGGNQAALNAGNNADQVNIFIL